MKTTDRIEQLKKFLEQNPEDSFVLYALATEFVNLHDDDTALIFYNKLISVNPDYTGVYYHLGKLYQRRNEKLKAEEVFNDGLIRTMGKDAHANRELREALNQLLFEEED